MKVTTLGCIQGAWLPNFSPDRILDIGAGTGLLSLMSAQKYTGTVDAVEIDDHAYSQLRENIIQSPWNNRINYHHIDIIDFTKHNSKLYDFIISNPPFFANHLKSKDDRLNKAKHENSLTIRVLLEICNAFLINHGKLSILLPPAETHLLENICFDFSLFISDQLVISDSPKKEPKAFVTILSRNQIKPTENHLNIKQANGSFSNSFVALLKDYYLYL